MIRSIMTIRKIYTIQNTKHFSLPERALLQQVASDLKKSEKFLKSDRSVDNLKQYLVCCFKKSDNLSDYALYLIKNACNRGSNSLSLIFNIVSVLSQYTGYHHLELHLTVAQKTEILNSVLKHKDFSLLQLVCGVFNISEQSESFKNFVEELIQQEKLIEAGYCITMLKLHSMFPIEKVLIPLLLDLKIKSAVIYLTDKPDLQIEAVKELDKLLDSKLLSKSHPVQSRRALKALNEVLSAFNIPLVHCQNLLLIRSRAAVSVLIQRRRQQSVSEETWEDMVLDVVKNNEELQKFLIKKLLSVKDIITASRMAERFNMNVIDFQDKDILDCSEEITSIEDDDLDENLSQTSHEGTYADGHLEFSLSLDDINVITSREDFLSCIRDIYENYKILGIDSEWKPYFGLSHERLSLIQVGLHDKVYILDLLKLNDCLEEEDWNKLMDDIFSNPNIIKLGCGIMSDIKMIIENIRCSLGKAMIFSHILDIGIFYQKLQEIYPEEVQNTYQKPTKGLSYLCETIIGKPLNKNERLCDWEKRPLTDSQLKYAALDAHCLLEMYRKLEKFSAEHEINFEHLVNMAIILTTNQWKPKRRYKGTKEARSVHINAPLHIQNFKLIVDYSFKSLGRQLRQFGADVIILEPDHSLDDIVRVWQTEKRQIICSKTLMMQVKDKVSEGFCHLFYSNVVTVSQILQHFNVYVSSASIYSRCIECNSADGIKIETEDFKSLRKFCQPNKTISYSDLEKLSFYLSSGLQETVTHILSSGVNINLSCCNKSAENDSAFLCKKCGHIS